MRVGTRRSPAVTKATTTPTTERTRALRNLPASRLSRWLLPLAVWVSACAAPVARPQAAVTHAARPLHRGPLTDYVSAAGLRWLVLVKPQQVLENPELGAAIARIVPSVRFDAFAEASGVDLRTVPDAAVAGFSYATLYLVQLPAGTAEQARAHFGERLLAGAVTKRPHPALVRITGVIGQTPETLLTIDDRVLAVAVGDPVQAKIAEAYAEARLKSSPTALRGASLSALPALADDHVAILYAPGPFADEWQRAANGLLQSTVALAIAVQPIGHGKVATTLFLAGAWQDSAEDAGKQLEQAWLKLVHSSAGHLFELKEDSRVTVSPEVITLRVELELDALVRALRASVLGDLSQILNLRAKSEPEPRNPEHVIP